MTDKEKIIKELKEALDSLDITNKYRLNIIRAIEYLQEKPVEKDFEKALANEWKGYIDRGAATVDALEDNTQELAFAKGFYRGAKWQKEQIMKDAIDVEVKMGTDGYPYIPQIEAYDYDKDAPFVKEGDKLKVIVIKEE